MTFKQKIQHFFYYYKWHVIGAILVILLLGMFISSYLNKTEPDISIACISSHMPPDEVYDKFSNVLKDNKLLGDVNGDGETVFHFDPTVVDFENVSNKDYEIYEKIQVILSSGSQTITLAHQYVLEDYEWAFEDISEFVREDSKTITSSEDTIIGISVEGNKFLEDIGINTENLYVSIHQCTEKQKEKLEKQYEKAYEIVDLILKNQ